MDTILSKTTGTSQTGGPQTGGIGTMNPDQLKSLLVETIRVEKPRWAPALGNASFQLEENNLVITVAADFELTYNTMIEQADFLKKTVQQILKRNINIEITLANKPANDENTNIENLKSDEKITNLMDKIKGKIVNIE
jgi:hypothetical protein